MTDDTISLSADTAVPPQPPSSTHLTSVPLRHGSLGTAETIHNVAAYPYPDSMSQPFAMAGEYSLQVFHLDVQKKNEEKIPKLKANKAKPETLNCLANKAVYIQTPARIESMCFAPMSATDGILTMAMARNDQKVCVVQVAGTKNIPDRTTHRYMADMNFIHSRDTPINSVAFLPSNGGSLTLVTGSDDQRCRIVDVERCSIRRTISCGSRVISVQTHSDFPSSVLVSEEDGLIHLHDLRMSKSKSTTFRTDISEYGSPVAPLNDVHWHPKEAMNIGGVSDHRFYLWDLKAPRKPINRDAAQPNVMHFRWAPNRSGVFCTADYYDTFKIWDLNSNIHVAKQQIGRVGGITWAPFVPDLPLCCVTGADRSLNVWAME
eukprot:gb/GECH01003336.1/.p1 GENE.gb/GECH01003336.1/~~gb/GECH01003336.1/.p1  ORF type:complete len:376 (+),score=68.14 gb/GECH01003336.1/:1-1128(+)